MTVFLFFFFTDSRWLLLEAGLAAGIAIAQVRDTSDWDPGGHGGLVQRGCILDVFLRSSGKTCPQVGCACERRRVGQVSQSLCQVPEATACHGALRRRPAWHCEREAGAEHAGRQTGTPPGMILLGWLQPIEGSISQPRPDLLRTTYLCRYSPGGSVGGWLGPELARCLGANLSSAATTRVG